MTREPAPLRVMHLVYSLRPGGMEHGIVKLVNGLRQSAVASSVCSCQAADPAMKDMLRVPLFEFARKNGNDPAFIVRLAALMRRERPHIVHTHAWGTLCEGVVAARLAGVPHVIHGEHGTMELRPRNVRIQRWLWRRVTKVLSVSSRLADRLAAEIGHPRDRIDVIANGVDCSRFAGDRRGAARAALGLPAGAFVIGTVGRLVPVKAQSVLLQATARLAAAGIPCVTVIAGDGPLRAALAEESAALGIAGSVRFLGHRSDVEAVLGALDVFVLSSDSEGMSNTIIEAMAASLPVVATRVGGADELVREGGSGFLVPKSDPAALADRVATLYHDAALRRRMGDQGSRLADRQFSIARMVDDYQSMYLEVAGRGPLPHRHAPAACAQEPV